MNGAASGKARLVLSIALAASIIVAAIAAAGYLQLSSKLALKSEIAAEQGRQIQAQKVSIDAGKMEVEAKAVELAQVQSQVGVLSQELEKTRGELVQETSRGASLELEIDALNEQAAALQADISALQSKIQSDEKQIEQLTNMDVSSDRITVSHYGVGVDQNDRGVVFPIKVEIVKHGTGILSVDINNVQYEPGFQSAVRAAASAASAYSGESISDKDIVVRFAKSSTQGGDELVKVDGSSAGAIIAAMIVAGLSDRELDSSILVTGSIAEDGTVGPIGGLEEKVGAADDFGAKAMLVPESQVYDSDTLPVIGVADIDEVMVQLSG